MFYLENKALVIYKVFICQNCNIYLFYKIEIAFLKANDILTFVLYKCTDFGDFFSKNLAINLSK